MEHLSSAMEQQQEQQQIQQVRWRRDKVQELCSKGYSQREISQVLQVGVATLRDVKCPVVIFFADKDFQLSPDKDGLFLLNQLKQSGNQ
jgi:hypothetical protein